MLKSTWIIKISLIIDTDRKYGVLSEAKSIFPFSCAIFFQDMDDHGFS